MEDKRKGNVHYPLPDCLMGAFAMMFFQDPAVLEFQRRLQQQYNRNNLRTFFKIEDIPKDTQLRETLDNCSPEELNLVFPDFFHHLQRGKILELFRFPDDRYLLAVDGSGYFSSEKICCPSCLVKTTEKGKTLYQHQILQAALVHPLSRQVIPLAPEPIQNSDGTTKQDCEINAAKRIIHKIRKTHPKLKIVFVGDDLYSKQPFIDELKKARMSFILVAKPTDHKILYQWFSELKGLNGISRLKYRDLKKRELLYEWVNDIPLNGTKDADDVNYFEFSLTDNVKVTYHNSWVTDIPIAEHNIRELTKGGRCRWKIENEGFNTLKNQGYHIKHNFGHGKKNLSTIFFVLNVLAFFTHQIFELTDPLYQKCRSAFSSRKEFWNQLRCTVRILLFRSWEHMVSCILDPRQIRPP